MRYYYYIYLITDQERLVISETEIKKITEKNQSDGPVEPENGYCAW